MTCPIHYATIIMLQLTTNTEKTLHWFLIKQARKKSRRLSLVITSILTGQNQPIQQNNLHMVNQKKLIAPTIHRGASPNPPAMLPESIQPKMKINQENPINLQNQISISWKEDNRRENLFFFLVKGWYTAENFYNFFCMQHLQKVKP